MAEKEKNSDSLVARGGLNDAERSKKKVGLLVETVPHPREVQVCGLRHREMALT